MHKVERGFNYAKSIRRSPASRFVCVFGWSSVVGRALGRRNSQPVSRPARRSREIGSSAIDSPRRRQLGRSGRDGRQRQRPDDSIGGLGARSLAATAGAPPRVRPKLMGATNLLIVALCACETRAHCSAAGAGACFCAGRFPLRAAGAEKQIGSSNGLRNGRLGRRRRGKGFLSGHCWPASSGRRCTGDATGCPCAAVAAAAAGWDTCAPSARTPTSRVAESQAGRLSTGDAASRPVVPLGWRAPGWRLASAKDERDLRRGSRLVSLCARR